MNYEELYDCLGLSNTTITGKLIVPVRSGEWYTGGEVIGFKPGLFGGGEKYKKGKLKSYSSMDQHWIKKPMVLIAYNIFIYGKKPIVDWVPVDNVEFSVKNLKPKVKLDPMETPMPLKSYSEIYEEDAEHRRETLRLMCERFKDRDPNMKGLQGPLLSRGELDKLLLEREQDRLSKFTSDHFLENLENICPMLPASEADTNEC